MALGAAIEQYIAWRRAQGAHFQSQARRLRAYARAVGEGAGCDEAGREQADAFLAGNRPGPHGRVQRHTDLAGFYRYAMARGLATSAPLPAQAPRKPPSAPPHVYSRDELRRLLDATRTYAQRICQLEPHTMRALLLVLYGAGLRPGEALRIVLDDLDLRTALLTVRDTKFHKTRLVPLGPQLARVLREYAERRRAAGAPPAGEAAFLVNRDGTPLVAATVSQAFRRLRRAAGVASAEGAPRQPRLHDLRHAFAVHRLTAWYRQGEDVQRMLPLLSTYLGHSSVAATQIYLTLTPELSEEAMLRYERYAEGRQGGCDA